MVLCFQQREGEKKVPEGRESARHTDEHNTTHLFIQQRNSHIILIIVIHIPWLVQTKERERVQQRERETVPREEARQGEARRGEATLIDYNDDDEVSRRGDETRRDARMMMIVLKMTTR